MPSPEDLHAIAQDLLDACVGALDTIPTFDPDLDGTPDRTLISPGLPAFDCCDQLAVHASVVTDAPLSPGGLSAGIKHRTGGKINHVALVVHATRCVPVPDASGNPPTAAALTAVAAQVNADGWALWNHVYNLIRDGQLFALCDEVFWDGLRAINPSGGCGGWTLNLRAQLDGYEEVL